MFAEPCGVSLRSGQRWAGRCGSVWWAPVGLVRRWPRSLGRMCGLRLAAVADVRRSNAQAALEAAGWAAADVQTTDSAAVVRERVHAGRAVIVEAADLLAGAPLDVVVEATGRPEVSAQGDSGAAAGGNPRRERYCGVRRAVGCAVPAAGGVGWRGLQPSRWRPADLHQAAV